MVRRLVDAGASALVLPSLFEEEVLDDEVRAQPRARGRIRALRRGARLLPAGDVRPDDQDQSTAISPTSTPSGTAVDVPVIASLNATSTGSWIRYAGMLGRRRGIDAIELNVYDVAADPSRSGERGGSRAHRPRRRRLRRASTCPSRVKLSPYYSSLGHFARSCRRRRRRRDGAASTASTSPTSTSTRSRVIPRLELSSPWELRLPLRWIAILRPTRAGPVAGRQLSGIASGRDVAKALLVGADVADDDLRRAAPRSRAHRPGRGRTASVGDRARLRLGRPSCAAASAMPTARTPRRSSGPTTCERSTRGRHRSRGGRAGSRPRQPPTVD